MEELDPRWRTSSFSDNGGNCVEVGTTRRAVAVRDTKDRPGPVLAFAPDQWSRFLEAIKK